MMVFVDKYTGSIVEVNDDCFVVDIDPYISTTDDEIVDDEIVDKAVLYGTKVTDLIESYRKLQQA